MKRRAFIAALCGAAAWPLLARAQQPMPVVGFLGIRTPNDTDNSLIDAFSRGLAEAGFVDGRNVIIDFRQIADVSQMRAQAADLVARKIAVIYGSALAAQAAKEVTSTIPIVFVTTYDPVRDGLVGSFSRPGGNVTGIRLRAGNESTKLLEFLHEVVPTAKTVGVLVDPRLPGVELEKKTLAAAASALGLGLVFANASTENEIADAIGSFAQVRVGALFVNDVRYFESARSQIIALATKHALPAFSVARSLAVAGGLASYGASINDGIRQAGVYVGRILKGEKPGDLPVMQPIKFELVINLKAAKALGLEVPQSLLARDDEVIE